MKELKIKHRRRELTLTEKDLITDNGACYQLITQRYFVGSIMKGWHEQSYVLSKTTCKKLIKEGKLIIKKSDSENDLNYYKLA